ncbi:MAG: glutamate-5-semialdehyde dehydrogenase [Christensenellales bacterium]|jgi:glutamate-5-semialdehyde dehydrogenase
MQTVRELATAAKQAARILAQAGAERKNAALLAIAQDLWAGREDVLAANARDLARAAEAGMPASLQDRLRLTPARVEDMARGLEQVAALADPIGESPGAWRRPNGLTIAQVRVPLGVVGIIYEARPNVTIDCIGLCLKSGNAAVLRGGREAICSNRALAALARAAIARAGLPADCVALIEDTDRASAAELMRLNGLVDVLIPRGGAGLIASVVEQATVPVIQTGTGVCHTYLDAGCDPDMAVAIAVNAKAQRPSVCNAMETLLVHRDEPELLKRVVAALRQAGVEVRGCERVRALIPDCVPATEADWDTEYNDYILSVKLVDSLQQAMDHIAAHGTGHSEAIVTRDYARARAFQAQVDAAAVYVNASTRFTDGGEFGLGAEIGISNQKLHARGPMGLRELTTIKYLVNGDGQIRP